MNERPDLDAIHALTPKDLRWACDPARFGFETTADLVNCPINIIGQPRAQAALRLGLQNRARGYNVFVSGEVGSGRSTVVRRALDEFVQGEDAPDDLAYVHNFRDPDQPCLLRFPAGQGSRFREAMSELIDSIRSDLPKLFDSETYRKRRAAMVESASNEQKALLKDFEKRVQDQGFTLTHVQMGPYIRSTLVPLVAGNPVEVEQLETLVEQGKFKRDDLEEMLLKQSALRAELEGLSKQARDRDRGLRHELRALDRELASPVIQEAIAEVREGFDGDHLDEYLAEWMRDVLEHLEHFHDGAEERSEGAAPLDLGRYAVNLLVDNSKTRGRPIVWETTPSYRNLFGSVDKVKEETGDWSTDHTRIKAGSLLRANGGFLVFDAIDVLTEPGVWAALKRTLRHRQVEIQSVDPVFLFGGASIKPEAVPVDVKVLMIGTRHIHAILYGHDEDFKKIFKVKAELTTRTPLSDEEVNNYACMIHRRCERDGLPPFHRNAVAAIVEQAVRLAEHRGKLTTRFSEISDTVRESGHCAREAQSEFVDARHVEEALHQRAYRVNLIEEVLRQRIAEGAVLLDLEGTAVGQVNGLAVLDVGDHVFGQPSRITATTAMGRAGIIDIDREAAMSGAIHTKGVLILTGFLRARFARTKPLALTASIVFEQNYGGIDGDSASSAELYALLSSLSGAPIRQGIAVTGSVNQRGEIQPIGGVNEKIEGYFDLCRLTGLAGEQGVLLPRRNLPQLMLRRDVVDAVRDGQFHVWAVETVEEGLHVLTGLEAGAPDAKGDYPADSIFGRTDAELTRLAEEVRPYGLADRGLPA